jgi:arabinose-5-phosphate isomerase
LDFIKLFNQVLDNEANAIKKLIQLDQSKEILNTIKLFERLKLTGGSLVICGVGKSGLIAQKIASTFSSLGLTSYFLHPTEALHGDLGRLNNHDAMIFISKSGTTDEILKLMPFLKLDIDQRIAFVGNTKSSIAQLCGIVFDCSVEKEACLNDLAPTTSSTVALAVGDALAVLYEAIGGVSKEKFAVNHPAGLLGKSLSLKVKNLMLNLDQCPILNSQQTLKDALLLMTQKPVGMAIVLEANQFHGIIVEGDIRRALVNNQNALDVKLNQLVNTKPTFVQADDLAIEALKVMENAGRMLNVVPVFQNEKCVGALRLHDLLKEGFSVSSTK